MHVREERFGQRDAEELKKIEGILTVQRDLDALAAEKEAGAITVLDSDAHEPDDLLTQDIRQKVAMGAGLSEEEVHALLETNPQHLLRKLGFPVIH